MLEFSKGKIDYAIFVGEEQEGRNRGARTTFVVGTPKTEQILSVMKLEVAHNVYFGAGGRFGFNSDTVLSLLSDHCVDSITIESPIIDWKFLAEVLTAYTKSITWIVPIVWKGEVNVDGMKTMDLVLNDHRWAIGNVCFKVDANEQVAIFSANGTYLNNYSQGYINDRIVVQKET